MKKIIIILSVLLGITVLLFLFPRHISVQKNHVPKALQKEIAPEEINRVKHIETPESVKGIYMTSWIAATPTRRDELIEFIDTTPLNSVVIDIKDDTGKVSFDVDNVRVEKEGSVEVRIQDISGLIEMLHKKNIYVIGRIAVFQDPYYARTHPEDAVHFASTGEPWQDRKGQMWIDPSDREFWSYIIELARASHAKGFDEIQFDYIRFPSDGNIADISYPISESKIAENPKTARITLLTTFFSHISSELRDEFPISGDIFGVAVTDPGDNGIGQQYEKLLPYFDYVSPMVYPSHFGDGYEGFANPAEHPYEVVRASMGKAVSRKTKLETSTTTPVEVRKQVKEGELRPWLQDFDLGADYGINAVQGQIRALDEVGIDSWLLWDAGNHYTRGAF